VKTFFVVLWVAVAAVSLPTALLGDKQPDREEGFYRANAAYRDGRYPEAIQGYQELITSGHAGGHLFYNLGNAYFRSGALGRAILNYERARLLIPRDADLQFNLRYAKDRIVDAVPEIHSPSGALFFWLDALSLKEILVAFVVINGVFWLHLLLRLLYKPDWTYYVLVVLLVLWITAAFSLGMKGYQAAYDDRAVVISKEADILAGPDSADTLLFKLHEGTLVNHEREEDGWSLIRLSDGRRGWTRAEAIVRINASP
jgi:tetratricopeptide (TPR) repeat protein